MVTLLSIIGGIAIGMGLGLMSKQEKPSKRKKKNFFVRLGESGNPKYNWMGGYTESR